jgi:hypothetical protein
MSNLVRFFQKIDPVRRWTRFFNCPPSLGFVSAQGMCQLIFLVFFYDLLIEFFFSSPTASRPAFLPVQSVTGRSTL